MELPESSVVVLENCINLTCEAEFPDRTVNLGRPATDVPPSGTGGVAHAANAVAPRKTLH
jgi:hypothetical protein